MSSVTFNANTNAISKLSHKYVSFCSVMAVLYLFWFLAYATTPLLTEITIIRHIVWIILNTAYDWWWLYKNLFVNTKILEIQTNCFNLFIHLYWMIIWIFIVIIHKLGWDFNALKIFKNAKMTLKSRKMLYKSGFKLYLL